MRTVGSLMIALAALTALAVAGCTTDGYTPKCTPTNDWADCLEQAKGGSYYVDSGTPDNVVQPEAEAAADHNVQPEPQPESGPDTSPPDSDTPDTPPDSPAND